MAAVFLSRAGHAWWYEDETVGPIDRMKAQGLERVEIPAARVLPRHIAEAEKARREGRPPAWDVAG